MGIGRRIRIPVTSHGRKEALRDNGLAEERRDVYPQGEGREKPTAFAGEPEGPLLSIAGQEMAAADGLGSESENEINEEKVVREPAGEWEALRREAEEYKDKYLRAQAEMANYKKRLERRYVDQLKEEKKRLLKEFLTVADNLERALSHTEISENGLREGVKLTYQALRHTLAQEGVEEMAPEGKPFDPRYHEVMAAVPADQEPEMVVGQVQKGYLYRGEPLRPAKVNVAR